MNDAVGRPFFVVEKTIDPGMLKTLEDDIIPRLLHDVPEQPGSAKLKESPYLSRLILVFDREGSSPAFFKRMWETYRISCITYHKFPDDAWPEEWFVEQQVTMPRGETVTIRLAEMGSLVGSGKDAMWMREVRKLTNSGHQTSLISTAYALSHIHLAARMFSRWCQENFFGYMMHHFAIDLLAEYGVEDLPADKEVVNPAWRELNKMRNSLHSKLRYRQARFAEMTIHPKAEEDTKKYRNWVQKKADLFEEIQHLHRQLCIDHQVGQSKRDQQDGEQAAKQDAAFDQQAEELFFETDFAENDHFDKHDIGGGCGSRRTRRRWHWGTSGPRGARGCFRSHCRRPRCGSHRRRYWRSHSLSLESCGTALS